VATGEVAAMRPMSAERWAYEYSRDLVAEAVEIQCRLDVGDMTVDERKSIDARLSEIAGAVNAIEALMTRNSQQPHRLSVAKGHPVGR
jgi:hypothetical protein